MDAPPLSSAPAYPSSAWKCSASSNAELVRRLREGGLLHHPAAEEAMLRTDRAQYVPLDLVSLADPTLHTSGCVNQAPRQLRVILSPGTRVAS
mmetsp:Transcript_63243/g.200070  ORF Transcript_63243/g.200070 Transcript_63243/m.200070 type:complete len:93 (+) Transcript_63243:230-508(+)